MFALLTALNSLENHYKQEAIAISGLKKATNRQIDENGDGEISFQEFQEMMKAQSKWVNLRFKKFSNIRMIHVFWKWYFEDLENSLSFISRSYLDVQKNLTFIEMKL